MKVFNNLPKYAVIAVLGGGISFWLWQIIAPQRDFVEGKAIALHIPELSPLAMSGKANFDAVCAACHGKNAAGTEKGPPLVHNIYKPGHHPDEAFAVAARFGVRRHHWPFGNMPPQPGVSQEQIKTIIQYVRELQIANGIT